MAAITEMTSQEQKRWQTAKQRGEDYHMRLAAGKCPFVQVLGTGCLITNDRSICALNIRRGVKQELNCELKYWCDLSLVKSQQYQGTSCNHS